MAAVNAPSPAGGSPASPPRPGQPAVDLRAQVEALRRIALAVARPPQNEAAFIEHLVAELAAVLGVATAFVAVFADDARTRLRTLAVRFEGEVAPNFEYPVAGSPCEQVVGQDYRYVARGVLAQIEPGSVFAAAGLDAYAAFPLTDSRGTPRGVIGALDRRPIADGDAEHAETVLKVVAGRLVAELERLDAEAQLRQSEEQYRAIFNASADAMTLWDREVRRVDVNASHERIFGWAREEVLGRAYEAVAVPDADKSQLVALVRRALAGESCRAETQTRRKDGQLIHVELRTLPVSHRGEPHALAVARDITRRKAAETQLRASEEQYRAIFNASTDALALWDKNLRRVDVNTAHEKVTGYKRHQVIGHAYEGLAAQDADTAQLLDLVRRTLAGESCRAETQARRRDGRLIYAELRTIPVMHRGEPHALAIGRDITERRLAEAQLRQSEEQYRAIFNASEDAMVLWDDQFRRVDVNAAHERLYGFKREEVIGHGYEKLPYAPEYAEPRLDLVRRALAGESCSAELFALKKDGSYVLTEVHAIPFKHRGAPHVLATARDITERKRAEAELRAREEQYRAIFDGSADAMILWDGELRAVDVNEVYLRWTGHSRDEVLRGEHVRALDPEDVKARVALVRQALAGREGLMESIVRAKDGSQFDIELRYVPVRFGGVPMALAIGRDLRPRRAAEAERLQLEAQLRQAQKMEAIGQLTGGIAHDFNNILTSVLGYVVLAQGRAELHGDARLVHQLSQAKLATERARDLVAQMLAFARRRPGARRALKPLPLLQQAIEMLRPTLPSSMVLELEHEGGELPPIEADAVQLEQVIMNLVINARDAMEGAGRVDLALKRATGGWRCHSCGGAAPHARWLELTVADTGSGIAPETLARMFDPFFTTKAAGRGSGMGLAMVHGIVHEHGGHIGVDTAPGRGTTFRVLLPVASAAPAAPAGGQTPAERPAAPALRGHVLVVEDDALVGNFLVEQLTDWGLEATLMRDPRQAQAWLEDPANGTDLLLTDLTMPHLTGVQLAQAATRLRAGLPVLLVSADLGSTDARQLAAAGVRHTLPKPVAPALLRERLAQLLASG